MDANKKAVPGETSTAQKTALAGCDHITEPNINTQAARLLTALQTGQKINPLDAWARLGIYRLADVVFQLRGMGHSIQTDTVSVLNRFGETCRVAGYWLPSAGADHA
ncbi:MAG: Helix-turn-helix domain [Pseudomonadota bacterium]|jgi:hypothetical protein